ncbi:MAG TPA: hypothetical protein VF275_01240 [Gammaproteobacteria bacterium]
MHIKSPVRLVAVIISSILLTACGGGGTTPPPPGGTNPPAPGGTTPPPANPSPTVTVVETGPVMELTSVTLTATVKDADGDLAYTWTQTAGTPVALTGGDSAELSFTAPKTRNSETLAFEVTVNDGEATATTSTEVIVEEANGVVYSGIEETARIEHVYFHHPGLETPRKLNPNLDSTNHEFSSASPIYLLPDHKHVIYKYGIRLEDGSNTFNLYRAALDGSDETDITGDIVENGAIAAIKLSPDGKWLALTGDLETDEKRELFVMPVDGSEPRRKISGGASTENGDVSADHFYWSPDSTQLLFGGDINIDERYEVFVANISESNPLRISAEGIAQNNANLFIDVVEGTPFAWSPDGEYITFIEQANVDAPVELTAAKRDGSNRDMVMNNDPSQRLKFEWSNQGKLAFIFGIEDEWEDLFIYDPATGFDVWVGGARAIVNESGIGIGKVRKFQWSSDGESLAFTLERSITNIGVFVVPAGAISPDDRVRIDGETDEAASVANFAPDVSWLPDNRRFLFTKRIAGLERLYANGIEGTPPTDISGEFAGITSGVTSSYCTSPDGEYIIFNADIAGDGNSHLYRARTDGTERRTVTGDIIHADGIETTFRNGSCWSPDGTQVLFEGDLEQNGFGQLFAVPGDSTDGRDRIRVSNLLETDGNADGFPDGRWTEAVWVGPDAK